MGIFTKTNLGSVLLPYTCNTPLHVKLVVLK